MNNEFFQRDTDVARIGEGGKKPTPTPDPLPSDLKDTILEIAKGPKRVQGDSGSVEQHSIRDLIDLDKHLSAKEAAKKPGFGIRFAKLVPGGTCD
jgi:hypothetical protein